MTEEVAIMSRIRLRPFRGGVGFRRRRSFPAAWLSLLLSPLLPTAASAQSRATSYWNALEKADKRMAACQVKWKLTCAIMPDTSIEPAKESALAAERARLQGQKEDESRKITQATQQSAQLWRDGFTSLQTLEFHSDGKTIRCEVVYQPPRHKGQPAPTSQPRNFAVDFYDGQNTISLNRGEGSNSPTFGTLRRDKQEFLGHSAPGFAEPILMIGLPVTSSFPKTTSTWRPGSNASTILLETKTPNKIPMRARMTLSTKTWRPLAMEIINPNNNRTRTRYQASEYKSYPGGIWFPSMLTVTRTTETGRVVMKNEYRLLQARFNGDANLSGLKLNIPKDTTMLDYRFGTGKQVAYRIRNALPSDTQVRELITKQEMQLQQTHREAQQTRLKFSALSIGTIIAASLALLLWTRRPAKEPVK